MVDQYQQYKDRATAFAKSYGENPSFHIIDLMISVMMTRDKVREGGSFAQAVVRNDLRDAIGRADAECLANLRIIVLAAQFAHL